MTSNTENVNLVLDSTVIKRASDITVDLSKMVRKPFEITLSKERKTLFLPNNWDELVKSSYLCKLLTSLQGYEFVRILDQKVDLKFKPDVKSDLIIKSFGTLLFDEKVSDISKLNNKFVKIGLQSGLRHYFSQDKFDGSITQYLMCMNSHSIHQELFGNAWGTNYPVESRILSILVNYIKSLKKEFEVFKSLLIPYEEVVKRFGLKKNIHLSKALYDNEKDFVAVYLDNLRLPDTKEGYNRVAGFVGLQSFHQDVLRVQKELKKYKTVVKDIINRRLTSVFSSFKNKQEKRSAAKTELSVLVNNVKETPRWEPFNPTLIFRLIGLSAPSMVFFVKDTVETALYNWVKVVDEASEAERFDIFYQHLSSSKAAYSAYLDHLPLKA